jgi:ribosomal protein L21E
MNAQRTLEKIMVALGVDDKSEKKALKQTKLEDGTKVEAQDFQAGQAVFVVTEDKEKMGMPEGSYKMEDGKIMVVDDKGIIAEVMEPKKEEAESDEKKMGDDEEKMGDEEKMEEVEAANEDAVAPKKVVEQETISRETFFAEMSALKTLFSELKEDVANLTSQKEQAELQLSAAEKDLEEVKAQLAEEPASNGISHSPEGNGTAMPKMTFGQNGIRTTQSSVFEKISKIN